MNEQFWKSGVLIDRHLNQLVWPKMTIGDAQHISLLDEQYGLSSNRFRISFLLGEDEYVGVLNFSLHQFEGPTLEFALNRDKGEMFPDVQFTTDEEMEFYKKLLLCSLGERKKEHDLEWGTISLHEDGWTCEPYVWVVYKDK